MAVNILCSHKSRYGLLALTRPCLGGAAPLGTVWCTTWMTVASNYALLGSIAN